MDREQLTMIERCLNSEERWEIPPALRRSMPETLERIINDAAKPVRERLKAMDVAAKLDAINLAQQKASTPRVNVNVHLTDDARNAKLQAILGRQKLLPQANQSDTAEPAKE